MSLLNKLKWAWSCRRLLAGNDSYYPDVPHKKRLRIWADQMGFFFKHGYFEEYYYPYGFDRKEMTRKRMAAYIVPYRSFLYRVDRLNFQHPYFNEYEGKITGRVINQDKFFFFHLLSGLGFPTPKVLCYVRGGKPLYVDKGGLSDIDAFVKPVNGMMGHGVFALKIKGDEVWIDGERSSGEALEQILQGGDYLIQERIVQHPALEAFCPSCVNTLRLHTVIDAAGKVVSFGPMLRIGRLGSAVDNWACGGVIVGIDPASGRLKADGFMKPGFGTVSKMHPDTGTRYEGFQVPFYQEAEEMVVRLHGMMYRNHSIGWDVAITQDGPVIVEGNDLWEISMIQTVHGPMGHIQTLFP